MIVSNKRSEAIVDNDNSRGAYHVKCHVFKKKLETVRQRERKV